MRIVALPTVWLQSSASQGNPPPGPPPNWLAGYNTRRRVTVDHTRVSAPLTNFPALVRLASTNFNFASSLASGHDVRFTASDGTTLLDYERERHDSVAQLAEYHVRLPSVSNTAPTEFFIYYRNTATADGANPAGVWDANTVARWSLSENPAGTAPQMRDSTVNANHGTTQGAMTVGQSVEGRIGRALSFDGVDDFVVTTLNGLPASTADVTVEFWARPSGALTGNSIITSEPQPSENRINIHFPWSDGTVYWDFGNISAGRLVVGWNSAWNNVWAHYVMTSHGGVGQTIVRDNILLASDTTTSVFTRGTAVLRIARVGHTSWQGLCDEVRISNIARSPDWIGASFHSGNGTLLSVGPQEAW